MVLTTVQPRPRPPGLLKFIALLGAHRADSEADLLVTSVNLGSQRSSRTGVSVLTTILYITISMTILQYYCGLREIHSSEQVLHIARATCGVQTTLQLQSRRG